MMFFSRLFICCLLLISGAAHAISLDDLQQRFSQQQILRTEFEQQRTISGMSQPLNSSGNVLIAQPHGLVWNQTKPFTLTLIMTEAQMEQTMAGQAPQIITAKTNPQMFQFNSLLSALFHADRKTLEQNFTLNFRDLGHENWQLILQPKTTPLDKLFRQITLEGAQFLNTIQIDDMQGDNTRIRFSNQRTEPKTLTVNEKRYFSS